MTCLFNFNSLFRVAQLAASLHPGCEKMEREWENEEEKERVWGSGEEMERKWGYEERVRKWREWKNGEISLSSFPHFLFISPLSIHFLYQTLSQNVKYGTFVANFTKNLTCWPVSLNKSVLFNIILFCSSSVQNLDSRSDMARFCTSSFLVFFSKILKSLLFFRLNLVYT